MVALTEATEENPKENRNMLLLALLLAQHQWLMAWEFFVESLPALNVDLTLHA